MQRLLDRAVIAHAEQLRAAERADLAAAIAEQMGEQLLQLGLPLGYLVVKKGG